MGDWGVPASDPRCECRVLGRSENGSPVIGTTSRGDGADDLSHAQSDEHCERGDDDPSHGHHYSRIST
jgi:hypothetical protein